jgi:hypothetical protein
VRTYLLKLGFLDGRHGLMLAIYNAEYAYYKYVKLMFMQSPPRRPGVPCMTLPASVDTPATVDRAQATAGSPAGATAMPEADPPAAAETPSEEPPSLTSEVARRRLGERLRRITPFFAGTRRGFVLAFVGAGRRRQRRSRPFPRSSR